MKLEIRVSADVREVLDDGCVNVQTDWAVAIDGVDVGPEWYADPATQQMRALVSAVLERQANELMLPTDPDVLVYMQLGDAAVA